MSQDSIPLAILYWLRSTDFRSGEGTLSVTPPSEIKYAFLDDLDLELDYAVALAFDAIRARGGGETAS